MINQAIDACGDNITRREQAINEASQGVKGLWNKLSGNLPKPYPTLEESPLTRDDITKTLNVYEVKTDHFINLLNERLPDIQQNPQAAIKNLDNLLNESREKLDSLSFQASEALNTNNTERPIAVEERTIEPTSFDDLKSQYGIGVHGFVAPEVAENSLSQQIREAREIVEHNQQLRDEFSEKMATLTTEEKIDYLKSNPLELSADQLQDTLDTFSLIQQIELAQQQDLLPEELALSLSLGMGELAVTAPINWSVKMIANVAAIPSVAMGIDYDAIRDDLINRYSLESSENLDRLMQPLHEALAPTLSEIYQSAVDEYGEEQAKLMLKGVEGLSDLLLVSMLARGPIQAATDRMELEKLVQAELNNTDKVTRVAEEIRQQLSENALHLTKEKPKPIIDRHYPELRATPTVVAEVKINGQVFRDANQSARSLELFDVNKPTLISDEILAKQLKRPGREYPNGNMATAHAEVGLLQRMHDEGLLKNANIEMTVKGLDVCQYCKSDIVQTLKKAGAESIKIHALDRDTGLPKIYYWDNNMKKLIVLEN